MTMTDNALHECQPEDEGAHGLCEATEFVGKEQIEKGGTGGWDVSTKKCQCHWPQWYVPTTSATQEVESRRTTNSSLL